jgi:hypothetical protein
VVFCSDHPRLDKATCLMSHFCYYTGGNPALALMRAFFKS